jgi:D-arginine dehydrogenase
MDDVDVLIVGAGIAGASIGAALSGQLKVAVLEQEDEAGRHSTGRSAAMFLESYGPLGVRILTRASGPLLAELGAQAGQSMLSPRPMVMVAAPGQEADLQRQIEENEALESISPDEALRLAPMLRADLVAAAAIDHSASDIDVESLHRAYLRQLRANGAQLHTDAGLLAATWSDGLWHVDTAKGSVQAAILVNASGAWADEVARRCGVAPLGFAPRRRTAAIARATVAADGPMVVDVHEDWYFKPESGALLISPADATDSPACDARPEDEDVALAIERINEATTLKLRSVSSTWAGLRTFSPDGDLVLGADSGQPSFIWACGQGGYGIQSSAAAAAYVADIVLGKGNGDPDLARLVSPSRLPAFTGGAPRT